MFNCEACQDVKKYFKLLIFFILTFQLIAWIWWLINWSRTVERNFIKAFHIHFWSALCKALLMLDFVILLHGLKSFLMLRINFIGASWFICWCRSKSGCYRQRCAQKQQHKLEQSSIKMKWISIFSSFIVKFGVETSNDVDSVPKILHFIFVQCEFIWRVRFPFLHNLRASLMITYNIIENVK